MRLSTFRELRPLVLRVLRDADRPLTVAEVAERLGKTRKATRELLRHLAFAAEAHIATRYGELSGWAPGPRPDGHSDADLGSAAVSAGRVGTPGDVEVA